MLECTEYGNELDGYSFSFCVAPLKEGTGAPPKVAPQLIVRGPEQQGQSPIRCAIDAVRCSLPTGPSAAKRCLEVLRIEFQRRGAPLCWVKLVFNVWLTPRVVHLGKHHSE